MVNGRPYFATIVCVKVSKFLLSAIKLDDLDAVAPTMVADSYKTHWHGQ